MYLRYHASVFFFHNFYQQASDAKDGDKESWKKKS